MKTQLQYNNGFKVKFDGQTHQIDANVLINSLLHTTTILQEVSNKLSGTKINIKVKAPERGSFIIHVELIETVTDVIKNVFTRENIATAAQIVSVFVGIIALKKGLKGEQPKNVINTQNGTVVISAGNDKIEIDNTTYNIYMTNTIIQEAVTKNFESLQNDTSIEGYEVTDENDSPYVKIDKSEFASMTSDIDVSDKEKIIRVTAILYITRLSFDPSLKWELVYQGNRISAKVKDDEFYSRIDNGEQFSKWDSIEAEMDITQQLASPNGVYVNKSYSIIKILSHTPKDKQLGLYSE